MLRNGKSKIDKLKERIENNREERERYNKLHDALQDRIREIGEMPQKHRYPFWCDECQADFTGRADKVIRKLPKKMPIAWYIGYCPQRHRCIRRITDRRNDPYMARSFILKRDRARYRDDLLTPDDHRFWLLYGHLHGFDHYRQIDRPMTPEEAKAERDLKRRS